MATVYLIHLQEPIHHAQHYLGYCASETLEQRLNRHRSGNGARLLNVANERHILYIPVRIWECSDWKSAKDLERRIKKMKCAPDLCPICNPEGYMTRVPEQSKLLVG